MRRHWFVFFLFVLCAFTNENSTYRVVDNSSFDTGEVLDYKIHLGFLTGATASMTISDKIYNIYGRPCYKIEVFGKTSGLVDVFYKVKDKWGSYLDTTAIVPLRSYRYIREGSYRKNEIVHYDHRNDSVTVDRLDKKTLELKESAKFGIPDNAHDIVSGYYYIRTMDFSKVKENDIIRIDAFFGDELYDFKVKFLGREKVDTKLGDFNALVVAPIMPENKIFDGENSIKIWLSDDQNKIPLKVSAKMFVGTVEVDIKKYENLRN